MSKSILLDGTARRLFEQQMPAALQLDFTKNESGDYADPATHGIFVGFLVGQVTGVSQGIRISKTEFEEAYATASQEAHFSAAEVGATAGLNALDKAIEISDRDRRDVATSAAWVIDSLLVKHGDVLRTMVAESNMASYQKAS
jgi:hypothetical protein